MRKPLYCVSLNLTRESAWFSFSILLTLVLVALAGCGSLHLRPDPEISPPTTVDQAWAPPLSITDANASISDLQQLRSYRENDGPRNPREYDLPSLVDVALRTSPETRRTWYAALQANAQLGQSEAANYPKIEADAEGNYLKLPLQFPGQTLVIRNEVFQPQIRVSYDLLDFGRTIATERGAREQLVAANFAFNRAIQDLVFNVEKAYYVWSAANASVSAAEANLKLARTSLDAVQERHQAGLATGPQVLLAKQVEAEAAYDVENSNAMVHDAESNLRQAVGVAADTDITIKKNGLDHLPANLGDDVEKLMAGALKQRPDVAAQIAVVRAGMLLLRVPSPSFIPKLSSAGITDR